MGIKKIFNMKPPEEETDEQNRETLGSLGIPVKNNSRWKKHSKFEAFNQYAKEKSQGKRLFKPVGAGSPMSPPVSPDQGQPGSLLRSNPYATMDLDHASLANVGTIGSPYDQTSARLSPYEQPSNRLSPYEQQASVRPSPYEQQPSGRLSPYSNSRSSSNSSSKPNLYLRQSSPIESVKGHGLYPETSLDRSQSIARTSTRQFSPPITPISRHKSTFSNDHNAHDNSHDNYSAPSMSNNTLLNPYMARRSTMSSGTSIRSSSRRVSTPNRDDHNLEQAKLSLFHTSTSDTTSTIGLENLHINDVPEEEDLNEVPDYAASIRPTLTNNQYEPSIRPTRTNYEPSIRQTQTLQSQPSVSQDYSQYEAASITQGYLDYEPTIDLNEEPELEAEYDEPVHTFDFESERQQQLEQEQQEEDEDVDRIKQEIKFTKQQSVASTRNTVRMAGEAEVSGQNTLGMLGSQSEKLYEIERDLLLAKTQNVVATDKVKEMAKLDRSFMLVHVTNPFNSKRRMQKLETKIRNQRAEDNFMQQELRSQQYQSESELVSGLTEAERNEMSLTHSKYDIQQRLNLAKKYMFEEDDEDKDMELEISRNMDYIEHSTKKLNNMAKLIGDEVDAQQHRLRKIEDNTDDLDMEIHLNNHRLGGVMK